MPIALSMLPRPRLMDVGKPVAHTPLHMLRNPMTRADLWSAGVAFAQGHDPGSGG